MSSGDISMSISDDHMSIVLPDTQLSNGLDLAAVPSSDGSHTVKAPLPHKHSPSAAIPLSSTAISATTTSLSMPTSDNRPSSPNTASTRFKVQPTDAAMSMSYNNSQVTSGHSSTQQTHVVTSSSSALYQNSTTVQRTQSAPPHQSETQYKGDNRGSPVRRVHSDGTPSTNGHPAASMRRKRVSFPEGQALIKGFAHAPNPWYNVSLCTTENLVSAYMNTCNSHSVRPLQKLISQLNCIRDFGERINLLTLKGENLNSKHIESLEEIFRRVQFVTVDMESTHLDDESAIALFEMVEYYESVIHLKLSHNKNLGIRAWLSAARMIRKTPCLESLDIRGCSLNEQSIAALGRALRMGAFVNTLYIQECNLSCRGVMIISAALRTIPTIKELYLGDNNLQPSDGIQLGNLLRNNIHLHTLDIKGNHLQDIGIQHICDGLAEQPNGIGLKALNISGNHFSHASMNVLANALARTRSLNTLNISSNNITNEGFFVLKEGLLKNKSLCRLSLRATKLSDEGAVALAEYIADSYTISQLDLRENDIKTAGLLAVSMCLRVHQTVTRLEIDQNIKKENAVRDYQSQQRFFLDEIQSQLTLNADLQRSKLEKLLVQSKSELTAGSKASGGGSEPVRSPVTAPASTAETTPTETSAVPAPSASKTEQTDPTLYFDPLGAVSLPDDVTNQTSGSDVQVNTADIITVGSQEMGSSVDKTSATTTAIETIRSDVANDVISPVILPEVLGEQKDNNDCTIPQTSELGDPDLSAVPNKHASDPPCNEYPSSSDDLIKSPDSNKSEIIVTGEPTVEAENLPDEIISVSENSDEPVTTESTSLCDPSSNSESAPSLPESVSLSESAPHVTESPQDEQPATGGTQERTHSPQPEVIDNLNNNPASAPCVEPAVSEGDSEIAPVSNSIIESNIDASSHCHNVPTLKELAKDAQSEVLDERHNPEVTPLTDPQSEDRSDVIIANVESEVNTSPPLITVTGTELHAQDVVLDSASPSHAEHESNMPEPDSSHQDTHQGDMIEGGSDQIETNSTNDTAERSEDGKECINITSHAGEDNTTLSGGDNNGLSEEKEDNSELPTPENETVRVPSLSDLAEKACPS